MANRLSQLPLEVLLLSDVPVPARLSQLPLEVLHSSTVEVTAAQLSQLPLEVLLGAPAVGGERVDLFVWGPL